MSSMKHYIGLALIILPILALYAGGWRVVWRMNKEPGYCPDGGLGVMMIFSALPLILLGLWLV